MFAASGVKAYRCFSYRQCYNSGSVIHVVLLDLALSFSGKTSDREM